jgi:hypothetical protein
LGLVLEEETLRGIMCAVAPAVLTIKIDVTRTIIFFGSCNEFHKLVSLVVVVVVVVVLAFLVLGDFIAFNGFAFRD